MRGAGLWIRVDGRRIAIGIAALALLQVLLLPLLARRSAADDATPEKLNPYTGDAAAIAEGLKLYKKFNCYACHGLGGGGGMGPRLDDAGWKQSDGNDAALAKQIREGLAGMPAFGEMIDEDSTWKIIAFVRTLYKGDPDKITW